MKNLSLLAFAFVSSVSLAAQQSPSQGPALERGNIYYVSDLKLTAHEGQNPEVTHASGTNLSIDLVRNEVTLTLIPHSVCTPPRRCLFLVRPLEITLPIVSIDRDEECGARTIVAKQDDRMVDGDLQTLTISDNRGFFCPTFSAVIPTMVQYTTDGNDRQQGKEIRTSAEFEGVALQKFPAPAVPTSN